MTRPCMDCRRLFYADEHWKVRCLECYLQRKHRARFVARDQRSRVTLDADFLRELITLTHPDRHPPERFQQANAATARLLDLLAEQRRAAA